MKINKKPDVSLIMPDLQESFATIKELSANLQNAHAHQIYTWAMWGEDRSKKQEAAGMTAVDYANLLLRAIDVAKYEEISDEILMERVKIEGLLAKIK